MNVGALALALLMVPVLVLVLAGTTPASGGDAYPVCIGLKGGGLGSPHVDLTLSAVNDGSSTVILTGTPELKACP